MPLNVSSKSCALRLLAMASCRAQRASASARIRRSAALPAASKRQRLKPLSGGFVVVVFFFSVAQRTQK